MSESPHDENAESIIENIPDEVIKNLLRPLEQEDAHE